ncbi:FUSC family protein [Corynebacterium auriscanis]|uniref:FUSC family protein n=1 Tax=Corynebacterium auriscanis TaxID=99807 RepID=UPI0022454BF5|nr:FUSC family protein [Corynebacterium auriscanis]MCX2163371.1 FUSC family protein [Corynebacterium auriscanis]
MHTSAPRWPGATRAALALYVPGLICLALGFEQHMLLLAAGVFSVIYGEGQPYRTRWRYILISGALLIGGVMAGNAVGHVVWGHIDAGGTIWWLGLTATLTIIFGLVGTFIQNALLLPPPGVFFIIMVTGGASMSARGGLTPLDVGLWCAFGVLSGLIFGMAAFFVNPNGPEETTVDNLCSAVRDFEENPSIAGNHKAQTALAGAWSALDSAGIINGGRIIRPELSHLVERTLQARQDLMRINATSGVIPVSDELSDSPALVDPSRATIPLARPDVRTRINRSLTWNSHAMVAAQRMAFAGVISAAVGIALGFDRPDWAVVSAVIMLQWGPERIPGMVRGIQRMLGSIVGIGIFALLHHFEIGGFWMLTVLAIGQFGAEIFVVRNYAITVIFTTPIALMMGSSTTQNIGHVLASRTLEVFIAVLASVAVLWFLRPKAEARYHSFVAKNCRSAMGALLGALLVTTPRRALPERRDLQYELLTERRTVMSLAANHPLRADEVWERHQHMQRTGYMLLDYCHGRGHHEASLDDLSRLAAQVRLLLDEERPELSR